MHRRTVFFFPRSIIRQSPHKYVHNNRAQISMVILLIYRDVVFAEPRRRSGLINCGESINNILSRVIQVYRGKKGNVFDTAEIRHVAITQPRRWFFSQYYLQYVTFIIFVLWNSRLVLGRVYDVKIVAKFGNRCAGRACVVYVSSTKAPTRTGWRAAFSRIRGEI